MPIDQEHSLVRYDPSQHTLSHRAAGRRPAAQAAAPARRSAGPVHSAATAGPLRPHAAHSVYSPRLTPVATAALTGRVVDIFA